MTRRSARHAPPPAPRPTRSAAARPGSAARTPTEPTSRPHAKAPLRAGPSPSDGLPARPGRPGRPGTRLGAEGVALAYARDRRGALVAVARLDAASRRSLAPFSCPGCGDEVVAKLGAQVARHFAHRPGSDCPLTSPETALHFNAKERLLTLCAEAFAGVREVTLLTRCTSCRRLDARSLAAAGDAALAEGAVGPLRADVLVTRAGRASLALEVLVTHAVDAVKEAALAGAGVPAVEVDARDPWERDAPDGSVEVLCHRSLGFPSCPPCRAQVQAEADRALGGEAARVAELEAYRARGLFGKLLDLGDLAKVRRTFCCPDCGGRTLEAGPRLTEHPCPGHGKRPVAWRGYDGNLVVLSWWHRPKR